MKVLKRFKSRDGFSTLELTEHEGGDQFVLREMRRKWTYASVVSYITRQTAEDRLMCWLTNAACDGIRYQEV